MYVHNHGVNALQQLTTASTSLPAASLLFLKLNMNKKEQNHHFKTFLAYFFNNNRKRGINIPINIWTVPNNS